MEGKSSVITLSLNVGYSAVPRFALPEHVWTEGVMGHTVIYLYWLRNS